MLNLLKWLIKAAIFATVVLVLGNYLKIGKKTISDEVKTQISHAEKTDVLGEVKDWSHHLAPTEKKSIKTGRKTRDRHASHAQLIPPPGKGPSTAIKTADEEIPSTEREKLRTLMRELNSARESR